MKEAEIILDYRSDKFRESILYIHDNEYIKLHHGDPYLCKKYGKSIGFFNNWFHKYNLQILSNREKNLKYTCNSNYFECIDSPEKAYWLGFLYADGYIMKASRGQNRKVGVSVSKKDRELLELFLVCLNSNANINEYKVTSGYKVGAEYCRVTICDPKLAEDLIKAGCVEQKTDILKFPSENIVCKKLQNHFIRGYMDGDGTIYKTSSSGYTCFHVGFCGTDDILNNIMDIFIREKITDHRVKLEKRTNNQIVSSIRFGGNQITTKILNYLYKDAGVLLQRKHNLYLELLCLNIQIKNNHSRIYKCSVCGCENKNAKYYEWKEHDKYYKQIVCQRHYEQLKRNGYITNIGSRYELKKDFCEYCKDTESRLILVGKKYPNYMGRTLCKKHYDRLSNFGYLKDFKPNENIEEAT